MLNIKTRKSDVYENLWGLTSKIRQKVHSEIMWIVPGFVGDPIFSFLLSWSNHEGKGISKKLRG